MQSRQRLFAGSATHIPEIQDATVDLVVTSPPYPMIEMWDEIFVGQDHLIEESLAAGDGRAAFEKMHCLLDAAWEECSRVLKPGGIACINIGDATRTIDKDFQLYSNHSRILSSVLSRGFSALPDILWRKETNAPNKFMGSGMLPVGAYVTYEHEYVLILRKGFRREFSDQEKKRRRESAFFWEERNLWFSDVWFDIKGSTQALVDKTDRSRSAAFPFELAYRLICMYSIKGDVVYDPFCGTGTTLAASMAAGRNGVGLEYDENFMPIALRFLENMPAWSNEYNRNRLARHLDFVVKRISAGKNIKYKNAHYGFPVVTAQEQELIINDISEVENPTADEITVQYKTTPQAEFVREWTLEDLADTPPETNGANNIRANRDAASPSQTKLDI